jgi:hypothetical protein
MPYDYTSFNSMNTVALVSDELKVNVTVPLTDVSTYV